MLYRPCSFIKVELQQTSLIKCSALNDRYYAKYRLYDNQTETCIMLSDKYVMVWNAGTVFGTIKEPALIQMNCLLYSFDLTSNFCCVFLTLKESDRLGFPNLRLRCTTTQYTDGDMEKIMLTGGSFWAILVIIHADQMAIGEITKEDLIQRNLTGTSVFLPDDFKELANFKPIDLKTIKGIKLPDDPLLSSKRFEGDIDNLNSSTVHKFINNSNSLARAAIKEKWRLWPKKEIPYLIDRSYRPFGRQVILKAMEEYHQKTCLRFVPRTTQADYIYIKPDDGCYSLVGRTGGMQIVSLDEGCMMVGTIMHELMHSAGFFHEQSRTDRDENVKIVWKNIQRDAEDQFEKYGLNTITLLDLPYDYGSVMHYGPKAFSSNDKDTIVPLKNAGSSKMGQRDGFSALDVKKLRKLYACDDTNEYVAVVTRSPTAKPSNTSTNNCRDRKMACVIFKTFGYCDNDRQHMLEVCPRSCNLCDQLPKGAMPPNPSDDDDVFPAPTTEDPLCSDTNGHCEHWASQGYCKREGYASYVLLNCPKSCGTCGADPKALEEPTDEKCRDSSEKCSSYAAMDMCDRGRKRQFMRTNCRLSCGLCQPS